MGKWGNLTTHQFFYPLRSHMEFFYFCEIFWHRLLRELPETESLNGISGNLIDVCNIKNRAKVRLSKINLLNYCNTYIKKVQGGEV